MPLKWTIDKPEDVPATLREFYQKTESGTLALAVEGEPPGYVKAAKLAEFRDNNRGLNLRASQLAKENADLQAKLKAFEDMDPAEYEGDDAEFEEMEAKLKALEGVEEKLKLFEGVDPDEYRVLKSRPDDSARLAELEAALAAERTAHDDTRFRQAVSAEFLKTGGRTSAVDFMIAEAAKVFSVKDGAITTSEFSATSPGEPLTVAEWVLAQTQTAAFAFQPSRGGGASNFQNAAHGSGKRTISRDPLEFGQNLAAIARGDVTVE